MAPDAIAFYSEFMLLFMHFIQLTLIEEIKMVRSLKYLIFTLVEVNFVVYIVN